ncbi:ExbD/TolR family protein [Edaphobacter flagellatus]|uniref:ExbD/TolR family protein n=1 Tax=Edaphobacter flagellatus TaxID=1933044 RepID=UPI0021B2390B|nr:biopolymer transporter ExbD [Edaphobacter flagellatus]
MFPVAGCHTKAAAPQPPMIAASASADTSHTTAVSAGETAAPETRIVLTIYRDQRIFLGGNAVNLADLPQLLRQSSTDPANQAVTLRADEHVPFGAVTSVMNAAKQAGMMDIKLEALPVQNGSAK